MEGDTGAVSLRAMVVGTRCPCPHRYRRSRSTVSPQLSAFTGHGVPTNIDIHDIISQRVQVCNLNPTFYMADFAVNCAERYCQNKFVGSGCKSEPDAVNRVL